MSSAPKTSYPIVMRMQGMHPRNLAGYEKHRMRRGGDHGHCERTLMAHNRENGGAIVGHVSGGMIRLRAA